MSVIPGGPVMILLSSKPRDVGGIILGYATPESPYWAKVVDVVNRGTSPYVVGISGLVRAEPNGTVSVYVATA